ncbi:hypothetical protein [uncultured Xylophilus sp.]|uniref:hypothetical protein n=1 Tax=uncultured Xylophilus sp. TaxID=296832 RepID=UPI0025E1BA1B|nr:hypothetical protein [uncultured Xylophilus sp.]
MEEEPTNTATDGDSAGFTIDETLAPSEETDNILELVLWTITGVIFFIAAICIALSVD